MDNEQLLAAYVETGSTATLDEILRRNQNLLHHILKRFAYSRDLQQILVRVAGVGEPLQDVVQEVLVAPHDLVERRRRARLGCLLYTSDAADE